MGLHSARLTLFAPTPSFGLVTRRRRPHRCSALEEDDDLPPQQRNDLPNPKTPPLNSPKWRDSALITRQVRHPPIVEAQWLATANIVTAIHMDPALVKWNRTIPPYPLLTV